MTTRASPAAVRACLLAASLVVGACRHDMTPPTQVVSGPPQHNSPSTDLATIEVSDANPEVGSVVTVSARVTTPGTASAIGSFNARLVFNPDALVVIADSVHVNAAGGVNTSVRGIVRVAGASALGVGDQPLFSVQFVVRQRSALQGLSVSFSELSGTDFHSRAAAVVWASGLKEVRSANSRIRQ